MDQMLHLYKILLIYSTGSGWVKSKLEAVAMEGGGAGRGETPEDLTFHTSVL